MNYFELFGIGEAPVVDRSVLALKYFELQKKFHPDFYMNENEATQESATLQSAEINKAFNILRDPDRTIEYFLQLKGTITTDEKYSLPADFLAEMMELNESFEESENVMTQRVAEIEKDLLATISLPSNGDNATTITDRELQALKAYYYKKKYLKRILDRIAD